MNCWKLLAKQGQSAAKPRASEEGSTTIESIATKKHCCKEASTVGSKWNRSVRDLLKAKAIEDYDIV